jgi:hypothetical protein
MNIALDDIAISLFKKPLNECSEDELQQLTHQYPYFGPAQLLLAKKLSAVSNGKPNNSSFYEEQVQKTSLYFPNRVWLHHLLNDTGVAGIATYSQPISEEKELVTETEQSKPGPLIEPVMNEHKEAEITTGPVKEETVEQAADPVELPAFKIELLPANTGLTFEPYHTVDYFASQGIKTREDDRPKDRFSQQLKSFTEWLKTMKRIPASEIEMTVTNDAGIEKKVEQMAEHSIAERHVITEAMAEVWIKQGNKAKAEEIYHKLSLLDPLKSSYFATKIEDLKKTS